MTTPMEVDALAEAPLFQDLAAEQWAKLNALLHRKALPAGAFLMTEEQPGEVAYVIISGTLKVLSEQAADADVILAILGPGDVVGEMSLIEQTGRSATVMALEESLVAWIDRASFQSCLHTMPQLSYNLIRILSARLRVANAQIQALSSLDVYGRVARQLLAFADAYGTSGPNGDVEIGLRLTQSDLAAMVGASRMRVNQVMVAFKRRAYISVDQHYRITVHDAPALEKRCQ